MSDIQWRTVPPDGFARKGTMDTATIADGFEILQFADIHAPDIPAPDLGATFTGIWSGDVHHFVGGRLYVRVDTVPIGLQNITAEVRVYGLVAGIRDVIAVGQISNTSGPMVAQLRGYGQSFVTIGVEARKFIGQSPSTDPVSKMSFAIGGRLFR